MEDIIKAIIMGVVEGLTEFLPVSSTGHLILTGELLNFTGDRAKTFEVVIQLGAVLAVLVLYRQRFVKLLNFNLKKGSGLNAMHVALAMLPASVLAVVLHGVIKKYLFGPTTVLVGLVLGGILMIVADRSKRKIVAEELDDITYKQAFIIGCFQILSLWPGFSRSGSTISGGMLVGTSQKAAAEFTFIVSVPIMAGASTVDLIGSREFLTMADLPLFLIGLISAFVVGMIAVVTFINMMKKLRLSYFAYYRFALAALFFFIIL
ncbi:undecaprenyl-diphosphate phosphatase [Paenibacillus sp. 1011MAR3C5]|uniref:undecaprenyl-diphosphate phosphatase n=1 Tax=Paenibacillus sp. 1011MAR3C5 TaxID=1675787 RepID=UPI000E6D06F4|nr:undecaprenyl-diphosphate phosphatase [Paenibacillus sp. 1011MAR3C5]RJE86880.1 undecaprenyl-diphosphate phosphatase [Paenibacillus sp. 1011MAR3C5]